MISQSPPCVPLVPGGLVAPAAAARPMAGEGGLLSYEPLAANMLPSATPVLLPQGDAGNGGASGGGGSLHRKAWSDVEDSVVRRLVQQHGAPARGSSGQRARQQMVWGARGRHLRVRHCSMTEWPFIGWGAV